MRLLEGLYDPADADALVGDPLVGAIWIRLHDAIFGRANAGMMQCDDEPVIVENRRAGGTGLGIGGVPKHVFSALDQLVLADADLFSSGIRVLNDRQPLAV